MSETIKFNGDKYFDTDGVYDFSKGLKQTQINSYIPKLWSCAKANAIINIVVPHGSRAMFLVTLGGSNGSYATLYFLNVYSSNEITCTRLTGQYSMSQIVGTTNFQVSGADCLGIIALSETANYASITFS